MSIESNLSELERAILAQSEYVEKGLPGRILELVAEIQLYMSRGDYTDRTGNLRRSIKTKLEDYGLSVSMLNYGYFQSFGVKGTRGGEAIGLPPEVAGAFGVNEGYKFNFRSRVISPDSGLPYPARKKIAEYGIKPKDFYFTNIEDKLLKLLENDG